MVSIDLWVTSLELESSKSEVRIPCTRISYLTDCKFLLESSNAVHQGCQIGIFMPTFSNLANWKVVGSKKKKSLVCIST